MKRYIMTMNGFVAQFICILILIGLVPSTGFADQQKPNEPLQLFYETSASKVEEFDLGTYTVPSGKRLVIQFASAYGMIDWTGSVPKDEVVTLAIETTVNGQSATYYLTPLEIHYNSAYVSKTYSGNQQMDVYADPDTTVTIKGKVDSSCGNGTCADSLTFSISISGYLEQK